LIDKGDKNGIQLAGVYSGHVLVNGVAEINDKTFVTAGDTLRVWNKTTSECLRCLPTPCSVSCMIRTKDKLCIVLGMTNGIVEIRRNDSDLSVISSFTVHSSDRVCCLCELTDGSFVSGGLHDRMKRWDANGKILQSFSEHSSSTIRVIELTSDIIVASAGDKKVTIWKVSTGQLLHLLSLSRTTEGMVKLSKDNFMTGSIDKTIRVWNAMKGECIETIRTDAGVSALARLGDSIVSAHEDIVAFELRSLKYAFVFFYFSF